MTGTESTFLTRIKNGQFNTVIDQGLNLQLCLMCLLGSFRVPFAEYAAMTSVHRQMI
jgi:hypothetical protein